PGTVPEGRPRRRTGPESRGQGVSRLVSTRMLGAGQRTRAVAGPRLWCGADRRPRLDQGRGFRGFASSAAAGGRGLYAAARAFGDTAAADGAGEDEGGRRGGGQTPRIGPI